jgi:hypothetical protein
MSLSASATVVSGGPTSLLIRVGQRKGLPRRIASEVMAASDGWMHAKLTDYWDARVGAVEVACERLADLQPEQREVALAEIKACVQRHVAVLDRDWLIQMSIAFVDDLYKSASRMLRFDGECHAYLAASAIPLMETFASEGIRLQYLIDNAWPDWEEAAALVGTWFRSAGFGFICAQEIAPDLVLEARAGGRQAPSPGELPRLARAEANRAVTEHQQLGGSFAQLDMDVEPDSFERALEGSGGPNVVTVTRVEAPVPESRVDLIWPEGFSPRRGI